MVYATNTTSEQVLFIPRNGVGGDAKVVVAQEDFNADFNADFATPATSILHLRSTVRLRIAELAVSIEAMRNYYKVAVSLPIGFGLGEYEYELQDEGVIVATGLLEVHREIQRTIIQYGKKRTYKEYYGG